MKIVYTTCAFLIGIMIIISSVYFVGFDRNIYQEQYKKLEIAQKTGLSEDELTRVTEFLLSYCEDKHDDFSLYIMRHGETVQAFEPREAQHMVDVKALFVTFRLIRNILIIPFVLMAMFFFAKNKRRDILKHMLYGLLSCVLFVIFLGIFVALDFNTFWTFFHKVFFNNDLWLLDPSVSLIINMFPMGFFMALCTKIILFAVGGFAILALGCVAGMAVLKRRGA